MKRGLLPLVLAALGMMFAHYASAGSCGVSGVDLATQTMPKGDCDCAEGFCMAATVSPCGNCLTFAATVVFTATSSPEPLHRDAVEAERRFTGHRPPPELPPPETM